MEGGVQVKVLVVTPVAIVRTGFRLSAGPLTSSTVTPPVELVQLRVKGLPATTSKALLERTALALATVARAPTIAAKENRMMTMLIK